MILQASDLEVLRLICRSQSSELGWIIGWKAFPLSGTHPEVPPYGMALLLTLQRGAFVRVSGNGPMSEAVRKRVRTGLITLLILPY